MNKHQEAVLRIVIATTKKYQTWNRTIDHVCVDSEIETTLPVHFALMITPVVAGVHPMSGPTGLYFVVRSAALPCSDEHRLSNRIEKLYDIKAIVQPGAGLDLPVDLDNAEQRWLQDPEPNLLDCVDKRIALARSMFFDDPRKLAECVDSATIELLLSKGRTTSTQEVVARRAERPGFFTICHPDTADRVCNMFGDVPHLTKMVPENKIIVGNKLSEFAAPVYFLPYVAMIKRDGRYKTRFDLQYTDDADLMVDIVTL